MPRPRPYFMRQVRDDGIMPDSEYGLFLVAGGSDNRAYELLRKCRKGNVSIREVMLFDYRERRPGTDDLGHPYNGYRDTGFSTRPIDCSIFEPSACLKSLDDKNLLTSCNGQLALDISCFTKPYFFAILKYLQEYTPTKQVTVFYTEPSSYMFRSGLYHSTEGSLSVIEVPGYPGIQTGTTRKTLVVLLGFDGELSSFIHEQVSPDGLVVVNGFPAYYPKFKDTSLVCNERIVSSAGTDIYYAAANNPFDTYNLLRRLKDKNPGSFFNIAPLGTKPMALGACMLGLTCPSVRIVYPLPERYAEKTTEESWGSWAYRIDLPSSGTPSQNEENP